MVFRHSMAMVSVPPHSTSSKLNIAIPSPHYQQPNKSFSILHLMLFRYELAPGERIGEKRSKVYYSLHDKRCQTK